MSGYMNGVLSKLPLAAFVIDFFTNWQSQGSSILSCGVFETEQLMNSWNVNNNKHAYWKYREDL